MFFSSTSTSEQSYIVLPPGYSAAFDQNVVPGAGYGLQVIHFHFLSPRDFLELNPIDIKYSFEGNLVLKVSLCQLTNKSECCCL